MEFITWIQKRVKWISYVMCMAECDFFQYLRSAPFLLSSLASPFNFFFHYSPFSFTLFLHSVRHSLRLKHFTLHSDYYPTSLGVFMFISSNIPTAIFSRLPFFTTKGVKMTFFPTAFLCSFSGCFALYSRFHQQLRFSLVLLVLSIRSLLWLMTHWRVEFSLSTAITGKRSFKFAFNSIGCCVFYIMCCIEYYI